MRTLGTFARAAALAGALSISSNGLAQTVSPDALQAAKDLVALTSGQTTADMVANMTAQVWPQAEAALRRQYPNIDAAAVEDLRKEFERILIASINDLMKETPAIYARHFSAEEMRDMIAFYNTPVGAKTLRAMPQITAEIAAAMDPRAQALQEKINLAFLTVLHKRGLYAQ